MKEVNNINNENEEIEVDLGSEYGYDNLQDNSFLKDDEDNKIDPNEINHRNNEINDDMSDENDIEKEEEKVVEAKEEKVEAKVEEAEDDKVWYKTVQGDDTISSVEYDPTKYTKKTTDLEKDAYVKVGAFTNLFEDLSTDLKGILEGFKNAQVNKDANFIEGAGTEGPQDYKNIIKSIQEVVSIIDNETKDVPVDQLVKKTQNMFKLLATYEKKHKPNIRGHRSVESAKRYEIIHEFNKIRTPFVQMVNVIGTEAKKAIGYIQDELDFLDNKEGYIDFTTTSIADLKTEIFDKHKEEIVKDNDEEEVLEELDADARKACDYYKLNVQRKFYTDRILKYLHEHTSSAIDIDGYLKAEKDEFGRNHSIIKSLTASRYDLLEAGEVARILDVLKQDTRKIFRLRDIDDSLTNGDFKKKIEAISKAQAAGISSEINRITKDDKVDYNKNVIKMVNSSFDKYRSAYREIKGMRKDSDFEKKFNLKAPNENIAYQIACTAILSKAENTDIIFTENVTKTFNDHDYEAKGLRKIHGIDFIKESGIMDGINSFEDMPKLMARIEDPGFQKAFTDFKRKDTVKVMEMFQNEILEEAKIDAARGEKRRKLRNKKVDRQNKPQGKKKLKIKENRERAEEKLGDLMVDFARKGTPSKKLLGYFKYNDPARAYAFYKKAMDPQNKNIKLLDLRLTKDEIEAVRQEMNLQKPADEIKDEQKKIKSAADWDKKAQKVKQNKAMGKKF